MNYHACCTVSFCLLVFAQLSLAEDYDPQQPLSDSANAPLDLTVTDASRDRDIPIRVYLPKVERPAPVVLFSHGLGGSRETCGYLGEHWSGRGYAVVFLQHPGSDEKVWKDKPPLRRMMALKSAANRQNTQARFKDVPFVIDTLTAWNKGPGHRFYHRLDLDKLGMSGHSYGAVTAQALGGQSARLVGQRYREDRIKAALLLSPSVHGRTPAEEAFGDVKIPWLMMTGSEDTAPIGGMTVADRRKVYPALPESIDKYELFLHGAQHSAFTDRQLRPGTPPRNPNHHRLIKAISTAFWDWHLGQNQQARNWLHNHGPSRLLEPEDEWQLNLAKESR